jgi:hypothetical protein
VLEDERAGAARKVDHVFKLFRAVHRFEQTVCANVLNC